MTTDIRTRVAFVAALATAVLLSVISAVGYVAIVNATRASQVDFLNERIDELEERLADGDNALAAQLQLDLSLRVVREGEPRPEGGPGTLQVVRESSVDGVEAIVGRVSTRQIDNTLALLRMGLWASVLIVGLLVGVAAWLVVDRSLAPVRSLTKQARAIDANQSNELLPEAATGDEIAELAATFNTMLRKLRVADLERRRFVSDASHELRTPLMVLSADAEYTLDHGGDAAALAASVQEQSDRLSTLVDDLLTLATLDEGQSAAGENRTVGDLVADLAVVPAQPVAPPVLALLVPDVSHSIGNILANAERHKDSTVELAIAAVDGDVVITVDDDGPGIPDHQRADIFGRFYRPNAGRGRADGGAGLGLAIAKAEVAQAGGTILVDDSPLGGARFQVVVPIAAVPAPAGTS